MVRKKFNKKEIMVAISWTIVVLFFLSFYIWNQIESIQLGYKIGKQEEGLQALKKEVERLETEKSSLLALERVEKIAKEKLKLEKPKKKQIIYDNFRPKP